MTLSIEPSRHTVIEPYERTIEAAADRAIEELLRTIERLRHQDPLALAKALSWIASSDPHNDGEWARWTSEHLADQLYEDPF